MTSRNLKPAARIAALQMLVFEMNWSAFAWVERVQLLEEGSSVLLHVRHSTGLNQSELDACASMFQEVFNSAYPDGKTSLKVRYSTDDAVGGNWIELMSPELFKEIAQELAPWRLAGGR